MHLLGLILVGLVYTAFTALVFSLLTLWLGTMLTSFEVSGPEGWKFFDFYKRYLIIAAVFVFITIPIGGLAGLIALTIAYQYVFDAGWVQAAVIGIAGGAIAWLLFGLMALTILGPLGLL
jgi:hypothetical protein